MSLDAPTDDGVLGGCEDLVKDDCHWAIFLTLLRSRLCLGRAASLGLVEIDALDVSLALTAAILSARAVHGGGSL